MPASATAISRTETAAAGTRRMPAGPGRTSPRRRPGCDVVPMIGTARVWGTAAGIAPRLIHSRDAEPLGELDHVGAERLPAIVRLGAGQDEQVALADRHVPDRELRARSSSARRPSTISRVGRRAR